MATTKKYLRITFQCGPALKRKLDQRAKRENRTTSNMIVTLLDKALNGKEEENTE